MGWWSLWEPLQCEDALVLLLGAQSRTQYSKWGLLIAKHSGVKAFPELLAALLQKLPHVQLSCITVRARCWLTFTCSLPGSRSNCAQRREEWEYARGTALQTPRSVCFKYTQTELAPSIRIFCFIYFSHTFVIVHFPWKKRLRGKYIISCPLKNLFKKWQHFS